MIPVTGRSNGQRKPLRLALALLAALTLAAGCGQNPGGDSLDKAEAKPGAKASLRTERSPAAEPVAIEIPAIDVKAQIVPVALEPDGDMQTPDFGLAGWYTPGPRPGDEGPAVVVGHVDSKAGPDVFFRLRDLRPGDLIHIRQADGATSTFKAVGMEQAPKDQLPVKKIWSQTSEPVIRLLTCGGEFDRKTGHYKDNVIVYGSLAG